MNKADRKARAERVAVLASTWHPAVKYEVGKIVADFVADQATPNYVQVSREIQHIIGRRVRGATPYSLRSARVHYEVHRRLVAQGYLQVPKPDAVKGSGWHGNVVIRVITENIDLNALWNVHPEGADSGRLWVPVFRSNVFDPVHFDLMADVLWGLRDEIRPLEQQWSAVPGKLAQELRQKMPKLIDQFKLLPLTMWAGSGGSAAEDTDQQVLSRLPGKFSPSPIYPEGRVSGSVPTLVFELTAKPEPEPLPEVPYLVVDPEPPLTPVAEPSNEAKLIIEFIQKAAQEAIAASDLTTMELSSTDFGLLLDEVVALQVTATNYRDRLQKLHKWSQDERLMAEIRAAFGRE